MNKLSQSVKGQVFLKYLWQHDFYKTEGGVSPVLARDIKAIALEHNSIAENKVINNQTVFNWINGSVIPRWAKLAAFQLALRLEWRPVDMVDCLSVLMIETNRLEPSTVFTLAQEYEQRFSIHFPKPILNKIVKDQNH